MKRIAVCGEIYSANLGDGVIFESIEHLLFKKDIIAVPLDLSGRTSWGKDVINKESVAHNNLLKKIPRFLIRKSKFLSRSYSLINWTAYNRKKRKYLWEETIKSCDSVIIGGGQLFTDINFGFALEIFEIYKIAKRYKKPLAIFGCGVGEGWGSTARLMYKNIITYASYVSVRDYHSKEIILSYISNSVPIDVHPDPAFIVRKLYSKQESVFNNQSVIGFNIQPALHFRIFVPELINLSDEDYLNFWFKLIRGACLSGKKAVLLTNGDHNDFSEIEKLATKLANEGLSTQILSRPKTPEELIHQLDNIPWLICTRMHAGIISYGLNNSIISIAWDKKVSNVWSTIKKEYNVVPANTILKDDPWAYFSKHIEDVELNNLDLDLVYKDVSKAMDTCINALRLG
jgi:polysaccharide pyruvyl transferase WcaK-like protein